MIVGTRDGKERNADQSAVHGLSRFGTLLGRVGFSFGSNFYEFFEAVQLLERGRKSRELARRLPILHLTLLNFLDY